MDNARRKKRLMAEIRESVQQVMKEKNLTHEQVEEIFLGKHETPLNSMMEMMQNKMKEKGLTSEQVRDSIGLDKFKSK